MPREYKPVRAGQTGEEAATISQTPAPADKESHIAALLLSARNKC